MVKIKVYIMLRKNSVVVWQEQFYRKFLNFLNIKKVNVNYNKGLDIPFVRK